MIPRTLAGLLGFMVVVVFLVGQVTTTSTESRTKQLENDMMNSINQTGESTNIFNFVLNSGTVAFTTFAVIVGYVQNFLGLAGNVPTEVSIVFTIIILLIVIAIIKVSTMQGET